MFLTKISQNDMIRYKTNLCIVLGIFFHLYFEKVILNLYEYILLYIIKLLDQLFDLSYCFASCFEFKNVCIGIKSTIMCKFFKLNVFELPSNVVAVWKKCV